MSFQQLQIQKAEEQLRSQSNAHHAQLQNHLALLTSSIPSHLEVQTGLSDFQLSSSPNLAGHHDGRRRSTPRTSMPMDLSLQTGHCQSGREHDFHHPMKRAKTVSQPRSHMSAPTLTRSRSSRSGVANPGNPFSATGAGPGRPSTSRTDDQAVDYYGILMDSWSRDHYQQPADTSMYGNAMGQDQPASRALEVSHLGPNNGFQDVGEYLRSIGDSDMQQSTWTDSSFNTSPVAIMPPRNHLSPLDAVPFTYNMGLSPACGSLTSGPTLDSPMSRQNSCTLSMVGHMDMIRIGSQASYATDASHQHDLSGRHERTAPTSLGKRRSSQEDMMRAKGGRHYAIGLGSSAPNPSLLSRGFASLDRHESSSSASQSYNSLLVPSATHMQRSGSASTTLSWDPSSGEDKDVDSSLQSPLMERSISVTSIKSNHSLKLRAKSVLNRQNQNAQKAALLQPKPAADIAKPQSAPPSSKTTSKDGKAAIAQAKKYERPKHPKIKCHQCGDCPEGFRGEHELRRHTEAKHKGVVKKFICRDPHDLGMPSTVEAINPLSKCKQCKAQKQYGAYYNAAAHLRRTHFKIKPSRGKGVGAKNSGEDAEKRGGKGGGDWPPMSELKNWMQEVTVDADQAGALAGDEMEDDSFDSQGTPQGIISTTVPYDAMAGVGSIFLSELASFDATNNGGFQNLGLIDLTAIYNGGIDDTPLSSANFHFGSTLEGGTPLGMIANGGSSYSSPNTSSSVATVTHANAFSDQQYFSPTNSNMMVPPHDDQLELDFGLGFNQY